MKSKKLVHTLVVLMAASVLAPLAANAQFPHQPPPHHQHPPRPQPPVPPPYFPPAPPPYFPPAPPPYNPPVPPPYNPPAPPPYNPPAPPPYYPPAPPPVYQSQYTAVYAGNSNNDQLLTVNYGEGMPGYRYNATPAFYTSSNLIPGAAEMTPIYRCSVSAKHFVSLQATCEGTNAEGSLGYVFKNPAPGLLLLQRYASQSRGIHLITTNPAEVASDFRFESVLGYVFPPSQLQAPVPVPFPTAPSAWVSVYAASANNGNDNLLTLIEGEGAPAYTDQGHAFYVIGDLNFANGQPVKPLYRCFTAGHHFVSNDGRCENTSVQGQYGWAYAVPVIGTVPLFRYASSSRGIHLVTAHPEQVPSDYHQESILGYVAP